MYRQLLARYISPDYFCKQAERKSINPFKTIKRMKKVLIALLCMATIALMISCSKSKTDMVVDGFEELVEEVEKKKGNLTVEEWNKMEEEFNNRFEELGIDKIDEKEFSTMQKLKIVALTVRWTAAMAESTPTLMESAAEKMKEEKTE